MKLYLIINKLGSDGSKSTTLPAFISAAQKANVELVVVDPEKFDSEILSEVTNQDLLFICATGKSAAMIEWQFLEKGVKNIYKDPLDRIIGFSRNPSFIFQNKVSIPKTEFSPSNDKGILRKQAERLGNFPLVIRVSATAGGTGVIKIDSFAGLLSTAQFLRSINKNFILREYIEHKIYGRLIVLGDKVIASKTNSIPEGDFRANEGEPTAKEFSEEINQEAIKATHLRGAYFGGADVIIDNDGKFYITEVNFPCSFISTQIVTGVDIAFEIINFLKNS